MLEIQTHAAPTDVGARYVKLILAQSEMHRYVQWNASFSMGWELSGAAAQQKPGTTQACRERYAEPNGLHVASFTKS
jgi:hypothetical protein